MISVVGIMRGGSGPPFAARPRDDPATGAEGARWQASGAPAVGPGKGSGTLEPFVAFCAELAELIEQDPDIPLVELQAALPARRWRALFDKWDRRTSAAPRIHI